MGKYSVARELYSQGTYMTAYEAVQEGLGKKVEIRLLSQKAGEASTELARFQAEIRNLANLDHPSILRVLDCGLINGKLYYVTDLKAAPNLQDCLNADPPLSLDDKVKIAIQIAGALRYMHARGIIHRGLNMAAVNFDAAVGLAYISQFFFMKNMNTDSLTVRGIGPIFSMLGTPEGVLGNPTDARTDVFLLGCLLFRLLTGQEAYLHEVFLGLTPEKLEQIQQRKARDADPNIPEALDLVVNRAIALQVEKRFQSAQDLQDALQDAQKKMKLPKFLERVSTSPSETGERTLGAGSSMIAKRRAATNVDGTKSTDGTPAAGKAAEKTKALVVPTKNRRKLLLGVGVTVMLLVTAAVVFLLANR
jgi:serine/threonine protein kinase